MADTTGGQTANGQGGALLRRLQSTRKQLSDGRRQLLDGILKSLDETVFLSTHELAARFSTDPGTVVRTVQALGYSGFPEFARDLRDHFLTHVNPYRIMAREVTVHQGPAFHVEACLSHDVQNVRASREALDSSAIAALGQRLYRCGEVVVVAGDLEYTFSQFLAYGLSALGMTAVAPASEGLTLHHQRRLTPGDGLIAIGFRRCLRVPVEAVNAARAAGVFTLAITDAATTPLAHFAEETLLVPVEGESFANSYVGTMLAINAILVACAHADPKQTLKMLKPTEDEYEHGLRWYHEELEPKPRRKPPRTRGAKRLGRGATP